MAKAEVFILATAFTFFIFLSQTLLNPNRSSNFDNPHGFRVRKGFDGPFFDPLVAKMPKKRGRISTKNHVEEGNEKYFYDDGSLRTSLRLMVLFPLVDKAPNDGFVDAKELQAWMVQQAINGLNDRTRRELELHDEDGDGAISFKEYLPQFSEEDIERNKTTHGEAGWWMEQFVNADVDRSGSLSLYEFRDFLYPEESKNDHVQKWLLREKIRQLDYDHDQKLNFEEFERGVYNNYKIYVEFENEGEDLPGPKDLFAKLDLDKDKMLRVEELKLIARYLNPGELQHAKFYSSYLLREADDNGDKRLTLHEMLNHDHIFYNTVYENERFDENEDDRSHDEL